MSAPIRPPNGATLSADERYRYALWREVLRPGASASALGACVVWVMLNPSTADALKDDPTIRKVMGFTKRRVGEAVSGYIAHVVNLYALRSTDPKGLWCPDARLLNEWDPVGPSGDAYLEDAISFADEVVFAWGGHKGPHMDERIRVVVRAMERRIRDRKSAPLCLGVTASGAPRHPLMLAYDTPFTTWRIP